MRPLFFFLLSTSTLRVDGAQVSTAGLTLQELDGSALSTVGGARTNPNGISPDPFDPYQPTERSIVPSPHIGFTVRLSVPANQSAPTDFGLFAGGTELQIVVTGIVNLGPPATSTNPDGSLARPSDLSCAICWAGYEYLLPGAGYPLVAGGDGLNHFSGGGSNYDIYFDSHKPWAAEGPMTTDTTDPRAIRFGEVAGTFSSDPVPNSLDWFAIGYGGTFLVPAGGAHLYVAVADTYYANNTGEYSVQVNPVPEPVGLAIPTLGIIWLWSIMRRVYRGEGRRQL